MSVVGHLLAQAGVSWLVGLGAWRTWQLVRARFTGGEHS
jgi:hypothetical protein